MSSAVTNPTEWRLERLKKLRIPITNLLGRGLFGDALTGATAGLALSMAPIKSPVGYPQVMRPHHLLQVSGAWRLAVTVDELKVLLPDSYRSFRKDFGGCFIGQTGDDTGYAHIGMELSR